MTTSSKTKTENLKKPSKTSKQLSKKVALLKRPPFAFERKVLTFARQEKLWGSGDTILLALSGGPDSVALFYFFLRLAKRDQLHLVIAHVNYQLRGQDSQADEDFVQHLSQEHSLPLHILRVQPKSTDEETLRKIRYQFFGQIKKKAKIDSIALAHHQDDQAETFLLQLFRGAGRTGLKSMSPKSLSLIRPFLKVTREEILIYLKKLRATYRVDKSNTDTTYLRNRVRHQLLPLLQQEYQSNIVAILARTALLLQQTSETLPPAQPILLLKKPHEWCFSQKEILDIPQPSRYTFFRHLVHEVTGKRLSLGQTQELEKFLQGTKNKIATLSLVGLKLTRKGDTVTLHSASIKE